MKSAIRTNADIAIHGMMYAADELDKALLGKTRSMATSLARCDGPFALALNRMVAIAEGGAIADREAVCTDLLFLFGLLHYLGGAFASSLWSVLAPVHEQVSEQLTESEAKALLGEDALWLDLDCRLGHIRPLVESDGAFRAYDASYLGSPRGEVRYARHEIEERAKVHAKQRASMQKFSSSKKQS